TDYLSACLSTALIVVLTYIIIRLALAAWPVGPAAAHTRGMHEVYRSTGTGRRGAGQSRIVCQRGDLPRGDPADLRAGVAVRGARKPGAQSGRLFPVADGHRFGDPHARPAGADPGAAQQLHAPRHEAVPLRPRQQPHLYLSVPRLELLDRRQPGRAAGRTGGRAGFRHALQVGTGQEAVGPEVGGPGL